MKWSPIRLWIVAAAVGWLAAAAHAERLVAIGDVHGDLGGLVAILEEADLLDAEGNWSGGDTTLIQTGDFLDRGLEVRGVMDLLMRLVEQAPSAGGRVIVLMGNHEAMNLLGFRRDVNPAAYAAFAESDSAARVDAAWSDFAKWQRQRARAKKEPQPESSAAVEQEWKSAHPPGYFEYQDELARGSRYGIWLRSLPAIVQVGKVVFLHGGISPSLLSWSPERINERTWLEIEELDACRAELRKNRVIHESSEPIEMVREGLAELEAMREKIKKVPEPVARQLRSSIEVLSPCVGYQDWFLIKEESPLWFRGFARWTEQEGGEWIAGMLAALDAEHFVVGHTPRADGRIEARFGGQVFVIDTGMLASVYPGGRPSALEIVDGRFTAFYLDGRRPFDLPPIAPAGESSPRWTGADGLPLPFRTDDELLAFLNRAEVVSSEKLSQGTTKPLKLLLEKDGVRAHAIFRSVDVTRMRYRTPEGRFYPKFKDSFRFEPAAYWLDRMLGQNRVPPATLREFRGVHGSVQIWVSNVMSDSSRIEKGLTPPDVGPWIRQHAYRDLFDALIQNDDRNTGNSLIDRDTWKVWLIDHTRSFFEDKELVEPDKISFVDREVWRRLNELDPKQVRNQLDPFLTEYEIDGLLARWQKIVALIQSRIDDQGEDRVLFME